MPPASAIPSLSELVSSQSSHVPAAAGSLPLLPAPLAYLLAVSFTSPWIWQSSRPDCIVQNGYPLALELFDKKSSIPQFHGEATCDYWLPNWTQSFPSLQPVTVVRTVLASCFAFNNMK